MADRRNREVVSILADCSTGLPCGEFDPLITAGYNIGMDIGLQSAELVLIFAANLRARRHERHLTQQQVADAIGTSQAYIAQMERGIRAPGVELLAPLADTLGTTPDALLTPNIFATL